MASAEDTTIETVGGDGAVVVDGRGTGCASAPGTSDTTTTTAVGSTTQSSTAAIDCSKANAVAEAVVATVTSLQPP